MQTPIDPLVAEMVEQLDLDLREAFEERAAIVEFEAGVQRAHAEALALLNVLDRHPTRSWTSSCCAWSGRHASLLHRGFHRPRARACGGEASERGPGRRPALGAPGGVRRAGRAVVAE